jgi:chemosensory pili system protein ChpA (sensor histidine kinase/response regulator)
VRRAFHTLKGSARMVGLDDFGEGAWACEQLYNARLGEAQPSADAALLAFTAEALDYFSRWREQIAGTEPGHSLPDPLRRSADALRLHGSLCRCTACGAAATEMADAAPEAVPAPLTVELPVSARRVECPASAPDLVLEPVAEAALPQPEVAGL